MDQKKKLLLFPYLVISAGVMLAYYVFCSYIYQQQGEAKIDEEVVNRWIPFIVPWIPVLIWLRPRIKLLRFKRTGRRNPDFLYFFVAAFSISIPCIILALYTETNLGKLIQVKNVDEINKFPPTRYYAIKNYFVDKNSSLTYYSSHPTGKYNSDLELDLYVACPVLTQAPKPPIMTERTGTDTLNPHEDSLRHEQLIATHQPIVIIDGKISSRQALNTINPDSVEKVTVLKGASAMALFGKDAVNGAMLVETKGNKHIDKEVRAVSPKAWLGIHYSETIRNHQSDEIEKAEENDFYHQSMYDFSLAYLSHIRYFTRLGNSSKKNGYANAIKKDGYNNDSLLIFEQGTGNFNARNGNRLQWIFLSYLIGASVFALMIFIPKLDEDKVSEFLKNKMAT